LEDTFWSILKNVLSFNVSGMSKIEDFLFFVTLDALSLSRGFCRKLCGSSAGCMVDGTRLAGWDDGD